MKRKSYQTLRMLTMFIVIIIIIVGSITQQGLGSLSALGIGAISTICPLGYIETAVASQTSTFRLFLPFIIIVVLTILVGRFFCGWLCPVPLTRKLFTNKLDTTNDYSRDCTNIKPADRVPAKKNIYSSLGVLVGTIGATAICGFPIFCLICPIGLIFATIFSIIRLIGFNEPTFDILLFPLILGLEFFLFRQWCSKFCPVGALLSLCGSFNRFFVPTIDKNKCLQAKNGINCKHCREVCSLDIDLNDNLGKGNLADCSKCRECADHCPVQAITFKRK